MTTTTPDDMLQMVVNDAVFLRWSWGNYEHLFGSTDRLATLNAAGPGFFGWAEMLIVDDIFLRISRLTDAAGNRWQENVTLESLLVSTGWKASDPVRWEQFSFRLTDVAQKCAGCRSHRNKRISHADLTVAKKAVALPTVTVAETRDAVLAIENFIHAIYPEIRPDAQQSFNILEGDRDVRRLLTYLENRPARSMPAAVSTIYELGEHWGALICGFCGATERSYLPPLSELNADRLVYWHFGECAYVIGTETVTIDIHRYNHGEPEQISVDLATK
jgi:hypothetical protein